MKISTEVSELLNIEYPIIQGGMAWVAEASLAAAVSNAGGIGLIGAANAPAEWLREQIAKARALTDKPFGVNIMMLSPYLEEVAKVVAEAGVALVTTGAGNPARFIEGWKSAGLKVIPVIPSVALAKRMERSGADAVVAEGTEAGGHIGETSTMALVPQVVDAVSIPVIAAGGIADGRTLAAALCLGAKGVQVGTRFLTARECHIHDNYRRLVIDANDTATAVNGRMVSRPVRALKNRLTRRLSELERNCTQDEFEEAAVGALRKAVIDGDLDGGSFMAGQVAGMLTRVQPAKEIIEEMFEEARQVLEA